MKKHKQIILYGIFGVATTLINVITYSLCAKVFNFNTILSTSIAWLVAVIFAFITNKLWVFNSKSRRLRTILIESASFFSCRILTGILDLAIMFLFVDKFKLNGLFMKVISNILVILLNYIASKFVIFKTEGKDKEHFVKKFFLILLLFGITLVFSMNSPLNFLKKGVSGTDSSVFRFFGMMMSKGYMPYLDMFDHKGPILYIINYIGYFIGKTSGVWLIEVIFLFISFYFIFKIARLKTKKSFPALLVLFLSTIKLFEYFQEGNLVEEYALPFLIVSLYIYLDYLFNDNINHLKTILVGACFACVFLLRANMISIFIVFSLAILIKCIKEKEYKKIGNHIVDFTVGILAVIIPVFLWLWSKGAFQAFLEDYILFNLQYSEAGGIQAEWSTFFTFMNNTILLIVIATNLYAIKKEPKKIVYLSNLLFIFLSLGMLSMSGRLYNHYAMSLIPTFIVPLTYFIDSIMKSKNKELSVVILIYLFSNLVMPSWVSLTENIGLQYMDRKKVISDNTTYIRDLILNNTTDEDKITVYGNWNYLYLITNRTSASKYSYQFPIATINPQILEEYFSELNQNNPKIIVIQNGFYNANIQDYLNTHSYKELWNNNGIFVYKLENQSI